MRVVVAPDSFGGTLSAVEAAAAVAAGWRRTAPADDVVTVPLSDGGPGFVDVLHAALGGELVGVEVADPLGRRVPATLLVTGGAGGTAWVESAQACGLHLLEPAERDPLRTTTHGVGELLAAAWGTGARRVVVGLGGSGTNDGGRGMLEALHGRRPGRGVELVAATDVDNPLLGPAGASAVFGPQKGASREDVAVLDHRLAGWAQAQGPAAAALPGAGAAGGLGYALYLLGARRVSGIATVTAATGLPAAVAEAGLVVTGEGSFDWQSLRGKVVSGVAALAAEHAVPCLVLAGQVSVGRREMLAAGVAEAHGVADLLGSVEAAKADPATGLAALAERVARAWSR